MDRSKLSEPLKIGVIIVTHNSEKTIAQVLAGLYSQIPAPYSVSVVDSGSSQTSELKRLSLLYGFDLALMPNIGFSAANNFGFSAIRSDVDYVLFLNPDLLLSPNVLADTVAFLEKEPAFAAASPLLMRYDFEKEEPLDAIDSAGIASTWYGRFYDRLQGETLSRASKRPFDEVEALCGAFFLARRQALKEVALYGKDVFDPRFFCYKEDIDLSLRLRDRAKKLAILNHVVAYHGRGWSREKMSRRLRIMSAKNELYLHLIRRNVIGALYSFCKWMGVVLFNL